MANTRGHVRPRVVVCSYGGGVQSATLLALVKDGNLSRPQALVFADTEWEPRWVYEQLGWAASTAAGLGIAFLQVSAGNIRKDALRSRVRGTVAEGVRGASLPYYTKNADGSVGALRRQCTQEYKIRPINRLLRRLAGGGRLPPGSVDLWLGISLDEVGRMKDSEVQWKRHVYPLIDLRMTRHDCVRYLESHGHPVPKRSACVGCPFHSDAEWREIKADAELWADAVAFDEAIRHNEKTRSPLFLHRSGQPLIDVDLRTAEERGQLSLWTEECSGHCGV